MNGSKIPRSSFKAFFKIVAILFLVLLPVWARCLVESAIYLSKAKVALEAGNKSIAIETLRRAVVWDAPGNVYAKQAADELLILADDSEFAIQALRELRRGLLTSRSFFYPRNSQADWRMQKLLSKLEKISPKDVNPPLRDSHSYEINYKAQVCAQIFFCLWVSAGFLLAFRGISKDLKIQFRTSIAYFALLAVSFAGWLYALGAN